MLDMAILSRWRPSKKQTADLARAYATHRPLIQRGLMSGFILYVLMSAYQTLAVRPNRRGTSRSSTSAADKEGKPTRVAVSPHSSMNVAHVSHQVDTVFYRRLRAILAIVVPSIRSKEALLLFMHSALLVFRTAISLYVAALDGK